MTGTSTSATSSAVRAWSARPVYICWAERGCSVIAWAPASASFGPSVEAVARAVAHAAAQLHRHGHRDRLGDGARDADRDLVVVERGCAGAGLRDLPHRAAEVDVDDVGAGCLAHARGLGDGAGIRAEDLHCERMLVAGDPQVAERALVAVREPAGRDHLGADEPRAEPTALPPERLHADTRHRRQHDARGDLDRVDEASSLKHRRHGGVVVAARCRAVSRPLPVNASS